MKVIQKTHSICDQCLKKVPAKTLEIDSRIFIEKDCPVHGKSRSDHFWDDPEIYKFLQSIETIKSRPAHLALVLTYKCNLECSICFANANRINVPDFSIDDLEKTKKYKLVFLSGGEPTVLPDLPKIINKLRKNGQLPVVLSNGLKLANKKYVKLLKKAGLRYVRMQLDTLNDENIKYFRGRNLLRNKLTAIKNMEECDLPISVCTVVIKKNMPDLGKLFRFVLNHANIKTISLNPLRRAGRFKEEDFVPSSKIVEKASKILGISKNDWLETTRFLINLDKLLFLINRKRSRYFSPCKLKCHILPYRQSGIPINKIFNVVKISEKIEGIYPRKNKLKLIALGFYFVINEIIINFFTNKYFRLLAFRTIKNLPYLFRRKYILFNPFHFFTISVFPVKRDIDFDFVRKCNFHGVSSGDLSFQPACIQRIFEVKDE